MNTSDMKEFENQLKNSNQENDTFMSEVMMHQDVQEMQNPEITQSKAGPSVQPGQTIKVQKSIILSYMSDVTGCGHIRNIFPMSYINGLFGKTGQRMVIMSPMFITQPDILIRARSIFFQRQMTPEHLRIIKEYKRLQSHYKYKMVWDMDDFIWGYNENQSGDNEDGVPTYNFGSKNISKEIKDTSVEIMNMMDVCTFSTKFLAEYAKNVLKVKADCVVVPNSVPQFFFGNTRKPQIKEKLVKPNVIYTGSPTHYSNEHKLLGDFNNAWKDWVLKSVKEDKINFTCMGGLPWFFEEIKDKIKVIDWVDSWSYANVLKNQNAHFGIAPLVPNNFNYSKSDIKYVEYSSLGIVGIGTTFTNGKPSPYDNNILKLPDNCTVQDIDDLFEKYSQPDEYNQVRNQQYDQLINDGRYLESPKYIQTMMNIF